MTSAKPSDAVRANVLSRIAVSPSSRLRAWRFGAAFGAVASVALVTFISWPNNLPLANPTISNPTVINPTVINSQFPPADPTAVPGVSSPVTSVAHIARVARTSAETYFAPSAAELEWMARATPALDHPDPLELKSLELRSIDIAPLGVAALVVPALGDGSNR